MQSVVNLVRPKYSSISFFVGSLKSAKNNALIFLRNYPKPLKLRNTNYSSNGSSSSDARMTNCGAQQNENGGGSHHGHDHPNKVDGSKKEEERNAKMVMGVQKEQGEKVIPKHVAAILDGNRRWLKHHGLDLDYRPFFRANIRFADCCLKWGVTTATIYIYGLGNFKHRTQEATDFYMGQFERFLEDELVYFMRKGVKVSVLGETSMLSESLQTTIEKVEEATKNNTNLDLTLATCYTSQRDIVEATKKICKEVQQGTMTLESVNEDLFEQYLSMCGSRPPLDLCIRTGGQLRIGALLAWQLPHAELYFSDVHAPDFGEDVFVDALKSFQQRNRMFGK